jgi:hypothetical protein
MTGKICWPCQREMQPKTNGVYIIEHAKAIPGPYKIWLADLWHCAGCGAKVALVTALTPPIAEHWQPEFKQVLEAAINSHQAIDVLESEE